MNFERLYSYRFRDIDQDARASVWEPIATKVHELMGHPETVLDPAAGRGEFIRSVPASERWAVDEVAYPEAEGGSGIKFLTSSIQTADLPVDYFDGVFASNFLEHLHTQEDIAEFLEKMRTHMRQGGRIAIMGPNYRYCSKEYWDCADHYVALTHVAVAEHLYAAGFEIDTIIPKFLPYSFRGMLPPSSRLTEMYLRIPIAWKVLGKQFLVIGRR